MPSDSRHFPPPSWPGLARPSTSLPLQKEDVDARDICAKTRFALSPGHDEAQPGGRHAL